MNVAHQIYEERTSQYRSCINLRGRRILPPLIDGARRAEMLHYKSLAVAVEQRIENALNRRQMTSKCCSVDSGIVTPSSSDTTFHRIRSVSPNLPTYNESITENDTSSSAEEVPLANEKQAQSIPVAVSQEDLTNFEMGLLINMKNPYCVEHIENEAGERDCDLQYLTSHMNEDFAYLPSDSFHPYKDSKKFYNELKFECNSRNEESQCPSQHCNYETSETEHTSHDNSPESAHQTASTDLYHYMNPSDRESDTSSNSHVEEEAGNRNEQFTDTETNYLYKTSEFLPLSAENFKLRRSHDNCKDNLLHDSSQLSEIESTTTTYVSKMSKCESEPDLQKATADSVSLTPRDSETTPQKLVRSNSYVLDSPSPQLLSHLRKMEEYIQTLDKRKKDSPKRKCHVSQKYKVHSRNSRNKFTFSQHSTEVTCTFDVNSSTSCDTSLPSSVSTSPNKSELIHSSRKCLPSPVSKKSGKVARELFTNDINRFKTSTQINSNFVESTVNNSPYKYSNKLRDSHEAAGNDYSMTVAKRNFAESSVKEMFLVLQAKFDEQLMELLAAQKKQQEELKEMFSQKQEMLLLDIRDKCLPSYPVSQEHVVSRDVECNMSHLECVPYIPSRYSDSTQDEPVREISEPAISRSRIPCSRQLFPDDTRKQLAASRIAAGVRGYLVRRLMKTERVRNLVSTVRDTLKCARDVELECLQDYTPSSDVDLHRRLLQQVEAACQKIHEIFFATSVEERMLMISSDREIVRRRSARPSSGQRQHLSVATRKSLERKMQNLQPKKECSVRQFHRPCSFLKESDGCSEKMKRKEWKMCKLPLELFQNTSLYGNTLSKMKDVKQDSMKPSVDSGGGRKPWR